MPIGFSFMPGADAQQSQDQRFGQVRSASTPQQAVNILSLRVPKTLPATAPVARELLTSAGSGAPGASDLTSFVEAMRRLFQPPAPMGAPMIPSQPPSRDTSPAPQAPQQSAPTFPSQAPQPTSPPPAPAPAPPFDFTGDALAPPPQQNAGGGGGYDAGFGFDPFENIWGSQGAYNDLDEERRRQLDQIWNNFLASQAAPPPPPRYQAPYPHVEFTENAPTGNGSGNA